VIFWISQKITWDIKNQLWYSETYENGRKHMKTNEYVWKRKNMPEKGRTVWKIDENGRKCIKTAKMYENRRKRLKRTKIHKNGRKLMKAYKNWRKRLKMDENI
jgi:hypothetical protein